MPHRANAQSIKCGWFPSLWLWGCTSALAIVACLWQVLTRWHSWELHEIRNGTKLCFPFQRRIREELILIWDKAVLRPEVAASLFESALDVARWELTTYLQLRSSPQTQYLPSKPAPSPAHRHCCLHCCNTHLNVHSYRKHITDQEQTLTFCRPTMTRCVFLEAKIKQGNILVKTTIENIFVKKNRLKTLTFKLGKVPHCQLCLWFVGLFFFWTAVSKQQRT